MSKNISRALLIIFVVVANIGCDQVTKQMAIDELSNKPSLFYLNDMFVLTFVKNDGAFLSLGSDFPAALQFILLKLLPVIMLLVLTGYIFFSKSLNKYQIIALSFILGGGISNIYDRLQFGEVVDFMNMGIGDIRTGIFNFADVSIMVGIGIFLVANFFVKTPQPVTESPTSETGSSGE